VQDSAEVQELLTSLSEVRAQLQSKTQAVRHMSGEVNEYHAQVDRLQRIVANLEAQLAVAQAEAKVSRNGAKRLRQLRRELHGLAGAAEDSGTSACTTPKTPHESEMALTPSDCGTPCSSRSRSMSFDGVNDAGHPPPPPQFTLPASHKAKRPSRGASAQSQVSERGPEQLPQIPVDPFYAGLVTRACASLPTAAGEQQTPAEERMAFAEQGADVSAEDTTVQGSASVPMVLLALDTGTASEEALPAEQLQQEIEPLAAGAGESCAGIGLALVPQAETHELAAATVSQRDADSTGVNPATPIALDIAPATDPPGPDTTSSVRVEPPYSVQSQRSANSSPRSALRNPDLPRTTSAYVDFGDVYCNEDGYVTSAEEAARDLASESHSTVHSSPDVPHVNPRTPLSRSMSAIPAYADIYECASYDEDGYDSFGGSIMEELSQEASAAVTPTPAGSQQVMAEFTFQGAVEGEGERTMGREDSAFSTVFGMLDRGLSDLQFGQVPSDSDLAVTSSAENGVQRFSSLDTDETANTYTSTDDLTYSAKESNVTFAGAVDREGALGTARVVSPIVGRDGASFNPLRMKRKSV
jgi:hypothetical protein